MDTAPDIQEPNGGWVLGLTIILFAVALPGIAVIALLGTLGTGKLGEGPLGWISLVAWWSILAIPVLGSVWAVRSRPRPSRKSPAKVALLIVLIALGMLTLLAGGAASIETAYNVSQGWGEPYMSNGEVVRGVSQFLLPLVGILVLLVVTTKVIVARFADKWIRTCRFTYALCVSAMALYSFELFPHLFSVS